MTDANATGVQIGTDAHETMTGTRGHDRIVEVRVGGGNHEHVARARNIWHIAVRNHLPLRETGTVRDIPRVLIEVMVADMVAGAQTI
jgi:hypothetical protein